MKKQVILAKFLIILALLLTACSSVPTPTAEDINTTSNNSESFSESNSYDLGIMADVMAARNENAQKYKDDKSEIVATVNGEPIYKSRLLLAKADIEKTNEIMIDAINKSDFPQDIKEGYLQNLKVYNEDDELQKAIKNEVFCQEAQKLGMTATAEETLAFVTEQYNTFIEQAESGVAMAQEVIEYYDSEMKKKNLMVDEYLKMLSNDSKRIILLTKINEKIMSQDLSEKGDPQKLTEDYYNSILDSYDIQIQ